MSNNFPPLWAHQARGLTLREHRAWCHAWEPRTGKTRKTLEEIKLWFSAPNPINRWLIAAPQTVCDNVWEPEIGLHFPITSGVVKREIVNLYKGTLASRKARLRQLAYHLAESNFQVIVLINREGIALLEKELLACRFEALVLDEFHDYKTPSSSRHKAAYHIRKGPGFRFIRGLTGTPIGKDYVDVYGQYKLLDDTIFGTRKEDFVARYCVMDPRTPGRIIGYQDANLAELQKKMFSIMDVVKKEDIFDMPDVQVVTRKIHLDDKVKDKYDAIVKTSVLGEEGGDLFALDHAFAKLTYLHQYAGGYAPPRPGFPGGWIHNDKVDACVQEANEIIDAGKKVVVFYHYTEEGKHITEALGYSKAALVNSNTSLSERKRLIDRFQNHAEPKVLVVQEEIGSVGLSFTAADYIIFYSMGLKSVTHGQAKERIFKIGSQHKLTHIYLTAVGTCDTWATRVVRNQMAKASDLLNHDFAAVAMGMVD